MLSGCDEARCEALEGERIEVDLHGRRVHSGESHLPRHDRRPVSSLSEHGMSVNKKAVRHEIFTRMDRSMCAMTYLPQEPYGEEVE